VRDWPELSNTNQLAAIVYKFADSHFFRCTILFHCSRKRLCT